MALTVHVGFTIPDDEDIALRTSSHFVNLGYRLTDHGSDVWVFQRGSKLATLWRSDIRAYETELTVRSVDQSDGGHWVSCDWDVYTFMNITTGGDVARLESEGRQLESVLRGSL